MRYSRSFSKRKVAYSKKRSFRRPYYRKRKSGTDEAGKTVHVRIDTQVNLVDLFSSPLAIGLYSPAMAIAGAGSGGMTIQQFPSLNATTSIYEGYYVKGV